MPRTTARPFSRTLDPALVTRRGHDGDHTVSRDAQAHPHKKELLRASENAGIALLGRGPSSLPTSGTSSLSGTDASSAPRALQQKARNRGNATLAMRAVAESPTMARVMAAKEKGEASHSAPTSDMDGGADVSDTIVDADSTVVSLLATRGTGLRSPPGGTVFSTMVKANPTANTLRQALHAEEDLHRKSAASSARAHLREEEARRTMYGSKRRRLERQSRRSARLSGALDGPNYGIGRLRKVWRPPFKSQEDATERLDVEDTARQKTDKDMSSETNGCGAKNTGEGVGGKMAGCFPGPSHASSDAHFGWSECLISSTARDGGIHFMAPSPDQRSVEKAGTPCDTPADSAKSDRSEDFANFSFYNFDRGSGSTTYEPSRTPQGVEYIEPDRERCDNTIHVRQPIPRGEAAWARLGPSLALPSGYEADCSASLSTSFGTSVNYSSLGGSSQTRSMPQTLSLEDGPARTNLFVPELFPVDKGTNVTSQHECHETEKRHLVATPTRCVQLRGFCDDDLEPARQVHAVVWKGQKAIASEC